MPGQVIFSAGDAGREMFIVRTGSVDLRIGDTCLETVEQGGIFGELALVDPAPRSATAVAGPDCTLVLVDAAAFDDLVRQVPGLAPRGDEGDGAPPPPHEPRRVAGPGPRPSACRAAGSARGTPRAWAGGRGSRRACRRSPRSSSASRRRASSCRSARPRSRRPTPFGWIASWIVSAIWTVRRSCTWSRRANMSTSRGIFERPTTLPFGM